MLNFLKQKFPADQFGYNVYNNSLLPFVDGAIVSHATWLGKSVDTRVLGRGFSVAAISAAQLAIFTKISNEKVQDHIIGGMLRRITETHSNFAFDPIIADQVNQHFAALVEDMQKQKSVDIYNNYASVTLTNIANLDNTDPNWSGAARVISQFAVNIRDSFIETLERFNKGNRLIA